MNEIKKNVLPLIIVLIVVNVCVIGLYKIFEITFYNETAQLIGSISDAENNKHSKQSNEENLLRVLKNKNANTEKHGKEILKKYGYKNGVVIFEKHIILILSLCFLFSVFVILIFLLIQKNQNLIQKRQIENSVNLIKSIKQKNYKINMQEVNNSFSKLNDEIYKTLVLFNETKQNALNEKKKYKESLENIAHQLKIPIASINIMLEVFEDQHPKLYAEIKDDNYFVKIKAQLLRLENLTETLLKLSKLEAGNIVMKQESFFIEECLQYALEIIEESLNTKNLFPKIDIPKIKINGDFYWIAEAFLNIIKNFLDLYPHITKIKISADENNVFTEMRFENDGPKLSSQDLTGVFNRFYSNNSAGFGIGLSMAKIILEKNNASINAENIKTGVAFVIKFYPHPLQTIET